MKHFAILFKFNQPSLKIKKMFKRYTSFAHLDSLKNKIVKYIFTHVLIFHKKTSSTFLRACLFFGRSYFAWLTIYIYIGCGRIIFILCPPNEHIIEKVCVQKIYIMKPKKNLWIIKKIVLLASQNLDSLTFFPPYQIFSEN